VTLPLAGVTVVVTRPRAQAARFATLVSEAGATPLLLPALEIEAIELDIEARARLAPDAYDWTIYTSANAVESSLRQLPRPTRSRIAAVGRGTARALAQHGIAVQAIPATTADTEGLLALEPFTLVAGQRILILKGEGGRTLLREELERRGATVATGDLYRRAPAVPDLASLAELERACAAGPVVVAVTSAESLAALLTALPDARLPRLRDATLLVPGERVAAAARTHEWRGPLRVATSAEDAAMAAALPGSIAPGAPPDGWPVPA
jgi:uroporphyrinogen-III synthase